MEQDELLNKFESSFAEMKKELGFKASLEELDEVFYFRDLILQAKFVSGKLSRMLCGRIRDSFDIWIRQMHEWLMPNPSSMIGVSESQAFSDEEKEKINMMMRKFMTLTSENIVIGLKKDKKREAEYIDEALGLWNDNKSSLISYTEKVNKHWKEQLKSSE